MPRHSLATGTEVHQPYQYIQEADPGAVGAGYFWLQVSTATLSRRNDANSAWVVMAGAGSVTSIGLIAPTGFSVSGSPVTGAGDITLSLDAQTGYKFLASPDTGGSGVPDFRAMVAADYPTMVGDSGSGGTKGAVPAPTAGDSAAGKFLKADGTYKVPRPNSEVTAVTYAATIAIDAATGDIFTITLTGNLTLDPPTNPTDGKKITIRLLQDGTGGWVVTLDSIFNIPSSTTPPLLFSLGAGQMDIFSACYNLASSKWDVIAFIPGY